MKKKISLIVIIILFALALSAYRNLENEREAEKLLGFLRSLQMRSTLSPEKARDVGFSNAACYGELCIFEKTIVNNPIGSIGLAPRTIFKSSILTSHGNVVGFNVGLGQPGKSDVYISSSADDNFKIKSLNVIEKDHSIEIFLTPRSTENERNASLNLKVSVLSRLGLVPNPSGLFNSPPPSSRD